MTATPAKRMSAALKRELVPALKASGFAGSFPRFRRDRSQEIHFLGVFYDKSATRFFLEFGAHERGDKLTSWGEVVPESKLMLEHVGFDRRARLQSRSRGGSVPQDWFAFAGLSEEAQFNALAASVVELLPQVEAWFASREAGPNVSLNGL